MKKLSVTLIELIVSMAIIAVISATVLVSMTLYDRRKLEIAGRTLNSDLMWARQMAVNTGTPYVVEFDLNDEAYFIYNNSVAPANLVRQEPLPAHVDLVSVHFPRVSGLFSPTITEVDLIPARVRFNPPLGTVTRADGTGISNVTTPAPNPVNVAMLNLTSAGRSVGVFIFSETAAGGYKPQYSVTGGWCFIATAAYQDTPEARAGMVPEEVRVLQQFRDRHLLTSRQGRVFIEFYYRVSPALARYIAERPWARQATRMLLKPLVWIAR
ncbi:MAG: hypothetical protein PHT59_03100, partial [Candidatus Omnitrophica bacterium]|nr:hypothetical protein [Candidatus Omnitrophota bacterium]